MSRHSLYFLYSAQCLSSFPFCARFKAVPERPFLRAHNNNFPSFSFSCAQLETADILFPSRAIFCGRVLFLFFPSFLLMSGHRNQRGLGKRKRERENAGSFLDFFIWSFTDGTTSRHSLSLTGTDLQEISSHY